MTIDDLDTPALVVDLDVMEQNIARVADYSRRHELRLRPHTKTHKSPELGRRQLASGAAGLTVAKSTEADVMAKSGVADLLIAYPVIGRAKLERLVHLSRQTSVSISIDSACAARQISEAFFAAGAEAGILAEVDVGLRRVGMAPGAELLELVRLIRRLPGLRFRGIAFYPGHIKRMDDAGMAALEEVDALISEAAAEIEGDGHPIELVSGGSTPALFESHRIGRMNEIRPGTYIFNDRNTWMTGACELEQCAAFILTTVVSTAVADQIIVDGGSKTFSSDRCAAPEAAGFGYFPGSPNAVLEKMNEEHGFVDVREEQRNWRVGEKIRIIPNHICVAVNLHERVYGIRGERVEEVWEVEARGKLQ